MPKPAENTVKIQELGKSIASSRKKAGLTQEYVAEELELTTEQISRIERGLSTPSAIRLMQLADLFDCSISELMGRSSSRRQEQIDYLHEMLSKLNPNDRDFVISMIEKMVSHLGEQTKL